MTLQTLYRHLISLGITFVATFFLTIGFEMSQPDFAFNAIALQAVILAALIAAGRAIAKVIYEICYNFLSTKK